MNGQPSRPAALVATLGTQPEVVTIALDLLLDQGEPIDEVVVIHTSSPRPTKGLPTGPPADLMARSLRALEQEFPGRAEYAHRQRRCRYRPVRLEVEGQPIDDVHSEADARAVFTTIFNEVQELKKRRYVVHLSIAGGRKSMSVYGMATAQLLFDSRDRLWHLFSSPEFETLSLMHPRGAEDARLVRIPVLPISTVFPGMVTLLTSRDPLSVLDNKLVVMDMEGRRDREQFMARLTPAEGQLVEVLMKPIVTEGRPPGDRDIARRLVLSSRTIANRFSAIYAKLEEHIGALPEEKVDRLLLISYLYPYFAEGTAP